MPFVVEYTTHHEAAALVHADDLAKRRDHVADGTLRYVDDLVELSNDKSPYGNG